GPDGADAVAWRLQLPPPRHERLAGFRVGLWLDDPRGAVAAEVGAALEAAAGALAGAGATVVPLEGAAARAGLDRPSLARLTAPYQLLLQATMSLGLPESAFAGLLAAVEAADPADDSEPIRHDHRRVRDRRLVVDGQERPYWDVLLWPSLANLAYLPATAVPVGRSA